MQVVAEHDNWRKVRDFDGTIGWMNRVVLSNQRTGMVLVEGARLYRDPTPDAQIVALMEDGLVGKLERCQEGWCNMQFDEMSGWIPQPQLYGVHRDEEFR